MSQRLVVVDDTDSSIHYTGNWFADTSGSQDNVGNYGPAYQSTLHGTKDDASFSFAFTGTKVIVLGSNNRVNNSGTLDPSWNCFVDGTAIGPTSFFQFPENNWNFCSKDSLSDGQHVITVNATVSSGHTFWFDSIQYVPSANSDLSQNAVLVDNHDSSLQFGSGWGALGGTANVTSVSNSIFTYEFTGTSLSWYGFIPTELPHGQSTASYSIDGGQATTFLLKGLPTNSATVYNQKFFQTPTLSSGQHKIVVTYLGNGQVTPLTLDYMIVQNFGTAPSSSSGGNSGGVNTNNGGNAPNTGGSSGPTVTVTGSAPLTSPSGAAPTSGSSSSGSSGSSPSGSNSNNGGSSGSGSANNGNSNNSGGSGTSGSDLASSSTHKSNNIGPIVGGIVGAVVLIALVLLAFFLYRRRSRRMSLETTFGNAGPLSSAATRANFVEPFQYSPVQTSPPPNMLSGSGGASFGQAAYGYGTLQYNSSGSQQHVPLPQTSPTHTGLSYTTRNNASTPTHGSMPSYTTTELQSAITSPVSATATTTATATSASTNSGYQVGYGGAPYTSEKMRREAEAVAAHTRATTNSSFDALHPVRPGQPGQPAPQDPFSDGLGSNSRMVIHEDSGIRLPLHAEGVEVVEVPPVYTPG